MERPIDARHAGALLLILSLFATSPANAALGRTPGAASVAHDGEAGYTIPIALPPGTNGMTPALSLEYRHRTQGELLGMGRSNLTPEEFAANNLSGTEKTLPLTTDSNLERA